MSHVKIPVYRPIFVDMQFYKVVLLLKRHMSHPNEVLMTMMMMPRLQYWVAEIRATIRVVRAPLKAIIICTGGDRRYDCM